MPNMLAVHEIEKNKGIVRSDATSAASIRGKQYLLVIAIDDYSNVEGFGNLNNPVKDADDLVKVLTELYDFEPLNETTAQQLEGVYKEKGVYEYHGKRLKCFYNQNASRTNIVNCLAEWSKNMGENDNLLIFFSGHGDASEDHLHLVTQEFGDESQRITYLDLVKSFTNFEKVANGVKLKRCRHFLLVLDCCNAGSPSFAAAENKREDADFSRCILAATHPTQLAKDGLPGKNSPFMSNLLDILKNKYELIHENEYGIVAEQLAAKLAPRRMGEVQRTFYGTLPGTARGNGHFTFYTRYNAPPQAPLNNSLYQLNFSNLAYTIREEFKIDKNRFNIIMLQNGKAETHRFLRKRVFKAIKSRSNLQGIYSISDDFNAWEPIDLSAVIYGNANFWQILKQVRSLKKTDDQSIKAEALEQIKGELGGKNLIILFYVKVGSNERVTEFSEKFCELAKGLYEACHQDNYLNKLFLIFSDLRGNTLTQDMEWFKSRLDPNMNIICPKAIPPIRQDDINDWVQETGLQELLSIERCAKLDLNGRELDFIDFLHEMLPLIGFNKDLKAHFIDQVISNHVI